MDEKKLPIWLTPFRPLLEGDINRRRAALCILSLYKTAPLCGDSPSLESITKRFEYPIKIRGTHRGEFLEQVNDHLFRSGSVARTKDAYMVVPYFKQVLEEMFPRTDCKRRLKQISSLNELHVTPRKGPNGSAIGTALADLLALYHSPHLLDSIRSLARLINHYDLLDLLDTDPTTSELLENREGKDALHSRLAIKLEPGAKTRFFAICDYFTQSVLKGFHKWIFRYLSGLREDGTKSQDSVCKIVKQWTIDAIDKNVDVYSTDLSKATDRLPALLQREIVWQIAGKDFAELWYTIVTQRSFTVPNCSERVQFAVGQPLGAYSSWAMLAVIHHVISRMALKLSGIKRSETHPHFVIVGDDNCLIGSDVSRNYHLLMEKYCCVQISPLKGFSKETLSGDNPLSTFITHSVAEFCKRVYYNGLEVSTVSPTTLKEGLEFPVSFPMLISEFEKLETLPD
jgi:hypothetical protein